MLRRLTVAFILAAVPSSAFSQEACTGLLTYAGRDFSDETTSNSIAESIYSEHCAASQSKSSGSGSIGIDAVVKAIPIKFSAGGASSQDKLDRFCKLYDSNRSEFRLNTSSSSTVVRSAIDAFNGCVAMTAKGIYFRPTIGLTQVSIDVRRGSDDAAITGLTYDESLLECRLPPRIKPDGSENQSTIANENSLLQLNGDYVTIPCLRKAVETNTGQKIYPFAELTIATSRGSVYVPIPADASLPLSRASEIEARAKEQAARLNDLEASQRKLVPLQLYKCPYDIEHRPGAWATWGCLGQISTTKECSNYTHLNQYVTKACTPVTAYIKSE